MTESTPPESTPTVRPIMTTTEVTVAVSHARRVDARHYRSVRAETIRIVSTTSNKGYGFATATVVYVSGHQYRKDGTISRSPGTVRFWPGTWPDWIAEVIEQVMPPA
jgi:hypothetical protein